MASALPASGPHPRTCARPPRSPGTRKTSSKKMPQSPLKAASTRGNSYISCILKNYPDDANTTPLKLRSHLMT